MAAADWERKRTGALGRAYFIAGAIHTEKGVYANADKELRAALPLIKGNDGMMGPALFHLGVANYQLGKMTLNKPRMLEGAKFSEESAAIVGPYAQQAWKNAMLIKRKPDGCADSQSPRRGMCDTGLFGDHANTHSLRRRAQSSGTARHPGGGT